VKEDLAGEEGVNTAKELLGIARRAGVNCFDHAEAYGVPTGEAERIFGVALGQLVEEDPELWRRSDLVITTKIFWGGEGVNEKGLSRKHIIEGLDASLERLQLDYVDMVFCHRPDPHTPTETVVRAMTDMVRSGVAMSWGTSEWSAQQITEAFWIAKSEGLEPPQFEQPQYNMLHRERFEQEYFPLFRPPYSIGTTIWSPLRSGFLTGKYNDGIPKKSRFTVKGYEWLGDVMESVDFKKINRVQEIAKSLEITPSQLSILWCLYNPNVSTVILGASNLKQLKENLNSIDYIDLITSDVVKKINK